MNATDAVSKTFQTSAIALIIRMSMVITISRSNWTLDNFLKKAAFFSLFVLFFSSYSVADADKAADKPDWYQLDLIVFRNDAAIETMTEQWPATQFRRPHPDATTLQPVSSIVITHPFSEIPIIMGAPEQDIVYRDLERDPFVILPESVQHLNEENQALIQSPDYTVLTKLAWRLPVVPEQQGTPVLITSPKDDNATFSLSGTVSMSTHRFLHIDVDLWYNELKPEALSTFLLKSDQAALRSQMKVAKNFQLKEKKRIQNTSEIQYLDTPVIGVLVKVTPYNVPPPDLILERNFDNTNTIPPAL